VDENSESYWVLSLVGGAQFIIEPSKMPTIFQGPSTDQLKPDEMVWLVDIDGSPVGFRYGAFACVWFSTPEVRESNQRNIKRFTDELPKEWEQP